MVKKIVIFFVVIVLLTVSCSKNAPVPLEKIDCIGKQLRIDGYSAGLIGGFSAGLATNIGALSGGAINGCGMALLGGESFKNVLINTGIGAATGWLGGISGNYAGKLGFMINNVRSPLLNGLIGGSIGGAAGGYVGGFTNGLIRTGQFSDAHDAGMNGLLSGMATGAITGSVAGLKYAHDNKIDPWTGEKTHQHHSDPKFLGGESNQKTTTMSASRHRELHKELNDHLKNQTNDMGNHMRLQKGNPGWKIQERFDRSLRINAVKQFYDSHRIKYWDARYDFYKNNGIRWTPW